MPSQDALMGLGLPAQLSAELGTNTQNLTTTGTTQAGAAKVLSRSVKLTTAASQTGAVIPAAGSAINEPYFFFNSTATTAVVYAPVGHTLNGAASTTGLNLPQNKACMLMQFAPGQWASILTA